MVANVHLWPSLSSLLAFFMPWLLQQFFPATDPPFTALPALFFAALIVIIFPQIFDTISFFYFSFCSSCHSFGQWRIPFSWLLCHVGLGFWHSRMSQALRILYLSCPKLVVGHFTKNFVFSKLRFRGAVIPEITLLLEHFTMQLKTNLKS